MKKSPKYIASFDSATAMLRATARYLHGKDFPTLGLRPASLLAPVAKAVNLLPDRPREHVYALSGGLSAIPPGDLGKVSAEDFASWAAGQYPEREYPAVMIGSSNGAAVHLCCALGIPWLPQTALIPVRRIGVHPDDFRADMEWGREHAAPLLKRNPDLVLYHMHDPNQDRLMIRYMTYFRVKQLRLGRAYERFLERALAPSGTIILLECRTTWPTTRVGDRHIFQPGAVGGLTPEEYLHGSDRVRALLERYDSPLREWDPPETDGERPEAEWGFESALREDIERVAREKGYRIQRIIFEGPDDLSPLVADLYRRWYEECEIPSGRLQVDSFILMEPWWALRTGSVPFWTTFPVESSARALETYLETADRFDEIHSMLFSHGTESAGLAPIERWRPLLERARKEGRFLGVDPEKFPLDFGVFGRYHEAMEEIPARHPLPEPLPLERFESFLEERGTRYAVERVRSVP